MVPLEPRTVVEQVSLEVRCLAGGVHGIHAKPVVRARQGLVWPFYADFRVGSVSHRVEPRSPTIFDGCVSAFLYSF